MPPRTGALDRALPPINDPFRQPTEPVGWPNRRIIIAGSRSGQVLVNQRLGWVDPPMDRSITSPGCDRVELADVAMTAARAGPGYPRRAATTRTGGLAARGERGVGPPWPACPSCRRNRPSQGRALSPAGLRVWCGCRRSDSSGACAASAASACKYCAANNTSR